MNLRDEAPVSHCETKPGGAAAVSAGGSLGVRMWSKAVQRYLLRMPKKVLNLELSSGAFSAPTLAGVAARELLAELSVDTGAEAAWAWSGARSAMEDEAGSRWADGEGGQ